MANSKYQQRGVSSQKEDVHQAIKNLDKGLFPKAFTKLLPDFDDPNYVIGLHADGAGTKSSLAYAYWKETGDLSVWKGIAQDALFMNIDDLLCVGCTGPFSISSTIGRNKRLVPGEVIAALIEGMQEQIDFLNDHGIQARNAGGETADVGDLVRTIIVDSTVHSRFPKSQVIDNASIAAGQVIVGLASFGQTSYEGAYNSGMGSNGLTSARHDLFHHSIKEKYPETCDEGIDPSVQYQGPFLLTDPSPLEGIDMGKLVLSPTRTYAPVLKAIFQEFEVHIKGMIHCTGGGQTKILHFLPDGLRVEKNTLFDTPPLFELIQKHSGTEWKEMMEVFNMGHRMELYTDEKTADSILKICENFRLEAKIIGRVEARQSNEPRLSIQHHNGQISTWT